MPEIGLHFSLTLRLYFSGLLELNHIAQIAMNVMTMRQTSSPIELFIFSGPFSLVDFVVLPVVGKIYRQLQGEFG